MTQKLTKNTLPPNHNKTDFLCFGPIANKDGEFSSTKLADLGCFKQGKVDSNKYFHGAVVQSKKTKSWYAYFEYGRTGQTTNPQFQFVEGPSESAAQAAYEKQLHSKNDKRGEWVDKGSLGTILQPKPNKDCYLVRPQTTRNTGLPDAKSITCGSTTIITKSFDTESDKLLKDLRLGATEFARATIVGEALPTQEAIEKVRLILDEATKINNKIRKTDYSLEVAELTSMAYSIIQKQKVRGGDRETWLLTAENVQKWRDDLDVYENAIGGMSNTISTDLPFDLKYIPKNDYLSKFMQSATKNRHSNVRGLKIKHIWEINKPDYILFQKAQNNIKWTNGKKPLHQIEREDLSDSEKATFKESGTWMLFHGTRTVNVGGILQQGLRLPKELSNVSINGALYGPGIYTADDWKKSANYCSLNNAIYAKGSGGITNRNAFMFICDVILGNPHIVSGAKAFTSPPKGYNSIFAEGGGYVMNNEFIVFDRNQVNLRYLVEFET